jgi:hypothetical protein
MCGHNEEYEDGKHHRAMEVYISSAAFVEMKKCVGVAEPTITFTVEVIMLLVGLGPLLLAYFLWGQLVGMQDDEGSSLSYLFLLAVGLVVLASVVLVVAFVLKLLFDRLRSGRSAADAGAVTTSDTGTRVGTISNDAIFERTRHKADADHSTTDKGAAVRKMLSPNFAIDFRVFWRVRAQLE